MYLLFKIIQYALPEYKETLQLREDVMRKPLGLLLSAEDIKDDNMRTHIGGYYNGKLVCTCSFKIIHGKIAHIYSVCVKQEFQNRGVGQQLMNFTEKYVKLHGAARLYVEGRKSAKKFYQKCGFSPCGSEYIDMNIQHQDMRKDI